MVSFFGAVRVGVVGGVALVSFFGVVRVGGVGGVALKSLFGAVRVGVVGGVAALRDGREVRVDARRRSEGKRSEEEFGRLLIGVGGWVTLRFWARLTSKKELGVAVGRWHFFGRGCSSSS
jgi:hypothetical protein